MATRGKNIGNLGTVTGLVLAMMVLWGGLQFWPRGVQTAPRQGRMEPVLHRDPVPSTDQTFESEIRPIPSPASSTPRSATEDVEPNSQPRVIDGPHKIARSAGEDAEIVTIDGARYAVTSPWLGHSLQQVIDPRHPGLVMLPREMAFEKRKIYVTVATRRAFLEMAEAAAHDGVLLLVDSGYRSAGYQRAIYRKRLAEGIGFAEIAKSVAPPGYSEHMLGCTLDLVPSNWSFKGTPAEHWLLANAERFSFVQSYPANNPKGFSWEPWHWKYVGDAGPGSRQVALPAGQQG